MEETGENTYGCGTTLSVAPEHEMEKVLFAADELTGLIWAAALMRPSGSTKDMELKSLKKKYKSKGFAAGCSREVIERGRRAVGPGFGKTAYPDLAGDGSYRGRNRSGNQQTVKEMIHGMAGI